MLHVLGFVSYTFTMKDVTKELQEGIDNAKEWLRSEFTNIRTGRATPALLDSVRVDSYGSLTPINQVASVSVEDARTIKIAPWDSTMAQKIESAITKADLGVSANTNDNIVRVSFPELTQETREKIAKVAKDKLEQARITVRQERDSARKEVQRREDEENLSEDEVARLEESIQKITETANKELEDLYEQKRQEIIG